MIKQYVQKPYKVQAEQYDPAADPLQAGVQVGPLLPETRSQGPHVMTPAGAHVLVAGDWIFTDLFHPDAYQVMSDAEFQAKFGSGAETLVPEGE